MLGIINVYKEKGYTSHDVVAILRRLTGAKAGHTGTLDPNAEGVLPICLGRATKFADYIQADSKTYVAEVMPGIVTTTSDMTGEIIKHAAAEAMSISTEDFTKAAARFTGEIEQIPPMYSAVKIGGKKLYELARKGEEVARKTRKVTIERIRVLERKEAVALGLNPSAEISVPCFFMEVICSKGTYIRTLCEDIGKALGCGAAMGALTRTRSGRFLLQDAVKIDTLRGAAQAGRLGEYVLAVDAVLPYPNATVHEEGVKAARNGNALAVWYVETKIKAVQKYWLSSPSGDLIGLFALTPDGTHLRAEVML